MRRKLVYLLGIIVLFVFIVTGWSLFIKKSTENMPTSFGSGNLIRLHVLANSDSNEDQQLKLKVRDAIISYLAPYLENTIDKNEAEKIIITHKEELIKVARQVIVTNGANYPVDIQMGIFDFPIKAYGSLVLPAGKYQAVRVLIGNAEGKNWWCVLFPPLCFIDATNATAVPLTDQENKDNIEFRCKLSEIFNN